MDIRDSISKPFKKLKRRFVKGSRKRVEGPQREHDTEGSETGQSSRPHLETEDVVESGPNQMENNGEGENADPPTSVPSIDNGNLTGEQTKFVLSLPLIVSSANVVASATTDPVKEGPPPDKSQPGTGDKNKSDWKSTASATAGVFLRGVRDSADAFGPLKSVAGGLCFILENCEVRSIFHVYHLYRLEAFQRTKANTQAIESLAPRVRDLSVTLCASKPETDLREQGRRMKLER